MRLGLGKWSGGLSDPRRDTQTNAGFPQETEGEIHRRRETQSQSPRQTNTRTEKGGAQANSERWMGPRSRNAAEAPHRSFGERATGRRRATRVSPHTLLRLESRARRGKRMCGGVSALEGRRGAQPESLTSSRPEAESPVCSARSLKCVSLWAGSRSGSGGPRSGGLGQAVSGSRSRSNCALALVAPGAALGR